MQTGRMPTTAIALLCLAVSAYATGQKGQSGGATVTHGNPHASTAAPTTPKTHGNPHTSTAPTTTAKTHGSPHTTTTPASATPVSTTTPTVTPTPALNPIAQKLQGKPLGARVEKMLPKGTTLNTASSGFKNQGQFIAAVHVSQNLGIPFATLKSTMLGSPATKTTTATSPMSLGQAIHKLRPAANAMTEAEHAQTQATADLETTTTTATKKTTTTKKHG